MIRISSRAAVAAAAVLITSACGESGAGSRADRPSNSTSGTSGVTPTADTAEAGLDDLCEDYCDLDDNDQICSLTSTNLHACGLPLAEGIDDVNSLVEGLDEIAPDARDRFDDVFDAAADAIAAYEIWAETAYCNVMFDTATDEDLFGSDQVLICKANASTASVTQATVGVTLRNAARSGN